MGKGTAGTGKMEMENEVSERYRAVCAKVRRACKDANRDERRLQLIAVSKTHPMAMIQAVLAQGHRIFGENYVQEAEGKWAEMKPLYSDLELHLIGPLQSNKIKNAIALFDVIHSLDRSSLAEAFFKEAEKGAALPKLLIQVNTGEEPQKAGVFPRDLPNFLALCRNDYGLNPIGLMCIPPVHEAPSPHFGFLRKLADRCGLEHCSMGMSSDFETAIQMGADYIRVGSSIFGERHY